jgi:hypothetical protein
MKTNTWLPVFSGFYNTIFEADFDNELDYLMSDQCIPKEILDFFYSSKLYYDECERYNKEVSKEVTKIIERELKTLGFLKSIKFQALKSPKEYNFVDDAIEIVFTKKNIQNIKKFIKENYELWTDYLRRYTSCDGFWSSYNSSPESGNWKDIDECLYHKHKCGSILEFICSINNITETTLYEDLEVYPYIDIDKLQEEFIEHSI